MSDGAPLAALQVSISPNGDAAPVRRGVQVGRSDVVFFGKAWEEVRAAAPGRAAERPARGGAQRRPKLEIRTLNPTTLAVPAGPLPLRFRWATEDRFRELRNVAWLVRNSRSGPSNHPAALHAFLVETVRLIVAGEPLYDVLEAFAELLMRP